MKSAIAAIILLLPSLALGGGYQSTSFDTYDSSTGMYYKSVASEEKSGFLSGGGRAAINLYIYNPTSNSGKLLLPQNDNTHIIAFAFEDSVENGEVNFYGAYAGAIMNNQDIAPRDPKDKILVLTQDAETQHKTFYVAHKDGSELTKVKTISPSADWHIDVKNSVVRVVRQVDANIKIESFAW